MARYLARENLPPYALTRRLVRNVAPQIDLAKYLDTYSKELKTALQGGVPENSYKKAKNGFYEILPNENTTTYPPVTPAENNFRRAGVHHQRREQRFGDISVFEMRGRKPSGDDCRTGNGR
jgi:hypothetical protein